MSARLDLIKSLIVPARIIADVGCDHGIIAEYCSNSGSCDKVIASDISDKCLQKARKRLTGAENAEFVCCDGIAYDCDEAVIAGMGGLAISGILRAAGVKPEIVVTSPHRDADTVRKTLIELGYGIERDVPLIDRGKFYSVIRARLGGGKRHLSDVQFMFGAELETPDPALGTYLIKLYNTYMLAPDKNEQMLAYVKQAMLYQGVQDSIK